VTFLGQALHWLATLRVQVTGVMTDNAFCFTQQTYTTALRARGLRHLRTRPYTPRTNGRRSASSRPLCEWAYGKPYRSSAPLPGALGAFLAAYNTTRPHTAHGPATSHQSPLSLNNLSDSDT
jgi:transposase InsO family protein